MRISYHCSLFTPHVGGIETTIEAMSRHAISKGHHVNVLTKKYPLTLPDEDHVGAIPVTRIHMPWTVDQFESLAYEFGQWLSENRDLDIIHAVGLRRPLPYFSVLMGAAANIPVVLSACGTDVPAKEDASSARIWAQGKGYMEAALQSTPTITAVSADTKDDVYRAIPDLHAKVRIVPCGIDANAIHAALSLEDMRETPYIISVRRLEPDKGIHVLLDAMQILVGRHGLNMPALVIAGDGSMKDALIDQASELRILPWVRFIGSIPHDTAMRWLRGASLCIVPSLVEGGGLINTEAHAAGCPVVASNTGGIPEYVSPDASILVPPGDPNALADAIDMYLLNETERRRASAKGIAFSDTRDWGTVFSEYENLYESAIPPNIDELVRLFPESERFYDIIKTTLAKSARSSR
ncbi:glycosyltransferase [Bifidobacterium animalis subsp. animalis]|nr:glycosyltransferase [Bifidobacterium animalis subsp. animalis]